MGRVVLHNQMEERFPVQKVVRVTIHHIEKMYVEQHPVVMYGTGK
jgi:hypothetical protein